MKPLFQASRAGRAMLRLTPERLFVVTVGSVVTITFAVIVLTLNRGFDWLDEGFVYSMIASNRAGGDEFWGFQFLLHPAYQLFGSSVLVFRIVRLLGYVVLAAVLTIIAKKILDSFDVTLRRSSWAVISLLAQVGTFAAWSYPPRYLGYNELSSWLAQLGVALLIWLLVSGRRAPTRSGAVTRVWLNWTFVGALVALLLVAKITAGLIFTVLALAVACVPSLQTAVWKRIGALLAGAVAALAVMMALRIPIVAYGRGVLEQLSNSAGREAGGYSLPSLLTNYLSSASLTIGALAVPALLAAGILGAVRWAADSSGDIASKPLPYWVGRFAVVLSVILALILLLPGTHSTWDGLGIAIAFTCCLALFAFFLVLPRQTREGPVTVGALPLAMSVVLFVAAPFVNGVGTNNPIFGQAVFSATLWAVGAGVALCALWERSGAGSRIVRFLPVVLVGVTVAGSGLSVASDVFLHPYNTQPYFKQSTPISVGDLRGIQVSEDEAALYEWLHDVGVREHAEDAPAVSIASPGALLAFNASAWAGQWPGPDRQASIVRACDEQRPSELYVLQRTDDSAGIDGLDAALQACRLSFPADFSVVDEHLADDPAHSVTVWRLDLQA